jgi:aerobic carbon-monoxide dehydrogenase small subunit
MSAPDPDRGVSDALHDPTTEDSRGGQGYPSSDGERDFPLETYVLSVNGRDLPVDDAWIGESLLYVLRERLGQPGSKNACEQGECGSCSVLMDGALVASCCVLAADAAGSAITTVEGLTGEGELSDVQRAFVEQGAVQCGFCIPGMVVAIHDLLDRNVDATELELREAISGNLCRCTGYGRIFAAFRQAQEGRIHAGA